MDTEKQEAHHLDPHQEDYLEVENNCCLCGTELVFLHEHGDNQDSVKEKAHCPCCNIQLKEKEHLIH